ncbi:MAG: hypothetical protein HC837_11770 [Chloroflexaceae bacterium]|nr:hypothetical protein [Chloroflexaceae bacterium]
MLQRIIIALALSMLLLPPYANAQEARPLNARPANMFLPPVEYMPQTGHNVWGPFLAFYKEHGGVDLFGYPITEVLEESGLLVQYFERARFEVHPDHLDTVQLSHLGRLLSAHRQDERAFQPHEPGNPEAVRYFAETGHNLSHTFRGFWEAHDGLVLFGLPISEALIETSNLTGASHVVQYFERARLEYYLPHPGAPAKTEVGLVGREYLLQHDFDPELVTAAQPIVVLGESTMRVPPYSAEMINVRAAANHFEGLVVKPGEQVSFLETLGEISGETGYVPGAAIVGGGIGYEIAGGICYLSTMMYRSVMEAGLEKIERHGHSLYLSDFNDVPGMDSAVFTSSGNGWIRGAYDLDLRWRNDTNAAVVITTDIMTSTGEVTVSIWGYDDGRTTEIRDVSVVDSAPSEPLWRYDENLSPCVVQQVMQGTSGRQIQRERVVISADGRTLHSDPITASYGATGDLFLYGSGIDVDLAQQDLVAAQRSCSLEQNTTERADTGSGSALPESQLSLPALDPGAALESAPDTSEPAAPVTQPAVPAVDPEVSDTALRNGGSGGLMEQVDAAFEQP